MTSWKYTDATHRVVARTLDDGRMESCLRAVLPDDAVVDPPDPRPHPRIAEIDAALAEIDRRSIRALREENAARIAQLESAAAALRAERNALT